VGGVILFSRNFEDVEQLVALTREIHALRQPPLLIAVDQEGGRVQRFKQPFVELPPMRALGHLHDTDRKAALAAAVDFGWLMAAELLAVGCDLSFAPVVDRDLGLAEVIGDRALHEDAEVVAELADAFVDGMQAAGMVPTAKHFPTHAGIRADSHTDLAIDRRDYSALFDDLLPYRRLIAAGLHSIMVAHVSFPKLDELPASLSHWWIETQLRRELRFTGAVISDDMQMAGAAAFGTPAERVQQALDAGCDLVLLCNCPDEVPAVIEQLESYSDPAAQLRLMRLRGRSKFDLETLRASDRWQAANERIERLTEPPALELEG
ncbi:MAG: beta-N-acetylhexosaminidase, partial [Gammaproteobacteria bacterium]|nr:beta-N-acetylhexosaminidase [Gammaproteobacteria bacterium]